MLIVEVSLTVIINNNFVFPDLRVANHLCTKGELKYLNKMDLPENPQMSNELKPKSL